MHMTRRTFLGYAAGAVTTGLHGLPGRRVDVRRPVVLLHLSQHTCESVAGYRGTLANSGMRFLHAEPSSVPRCAVLIVPAALRIGPAIRAIETCLSDGATVILESGACFAAEPAFRAHRAELRDCLQVQVDAPVRLWTAGSGRQRIPYVDYSWPHSAKIRDFSAVLPLARQPGEIIARVDGLPVCLKRQMGRGTLIFLGSPLGPALWAGDAEARRWLSLALGLHSARLPLLHE